MGVLVKRRSDKKTPMAVRYSVEARFFSIQNDGPLVGTTTIRSSLLVAIEPSLSVTTEKSHNCYAKNVPLGNEFLKRSLKTFLNHYSPQVKPF